MCFYKLNKTKVNNITSMDDNQAIELSQGIGEQREEDIISILVATDIHLGFGENDPIRSKDTFDTFEEILGIAQDKNVDFVLLGGDLFHNTRPSTYCLYKCTELLKRYCLGDKPVQVEFLSDPSHNFLYTGNDTVNYEDPNLNIALPVFSIHGNHDDPTGEQQISALNLLASTGLVNYFGKYNNHTAVDIEPILLKKGETKLALYGLSHIKDERLGRLFLDKNVTVMAPPETDWFHLLVLHQNRANRGAKTFIPDDSLPDMLNLVIWGHEHDCRITPELSSNNVYISQPGSSVATSLCLGESIPKHVGLLQIHKQKFNMSDIPLKTVRPFVFRDKMLKDLDSMQEDLLEYNDEPLTYQAKAEKIVEREIEEMISEAKQLGRRRDMLPLLRINVGYVDEKQTFNAIRFGQKYIGRVANPNDMVKLKSVIKRSNAKKGRKDGEEDFMDEAINLPSRVEDLVIQYFETNPEKKLKCLSLKTLNESVVQCIDANEADAPLEVTNYFIQKLRKKLEAELVETSKVDEFLENVKEQEEDVSVVNEILTANQRKKKANVKDQEVVIDDSSSEELTSPSKNNDSGSSQRGSSRPARGPGSRGGRGSRGRRGSRGK